MGTLPRRALPLSIGCALALAAVELAARVKLGPRFVFGAHVGAPQAICGEFDEHFGWRNRPATSVRIAADGFEYRVTLNERGERGPLRPHAKPPGVRRVVVLGDSTAWGWGVDDEAMWTRLVERELGPAVELVNLAVPGYGTDQELWALERAGLAYQPDLVLLAFVHNDTLSNRFKEMQGMAKPCYVRGEQGWKLENQPVPAPAEGSDLAARRLRRSLAMYSATFKLFEPPPPVPSRYDLADPKVLAGIERFWNDVADPDGWSYMLLGRVRKLSADSGARLLAFTFPHLVDRWLYDPTTPLPPDAATRPYRTYGSGTLAEAGRALGFETFSVDDALLDEVSKGTNLDCGDEHLNERGNEVLSRVVAAELRRALGL